MSPGCCESQISKLKDYFLSSVEMMHNSGPTTGRSSMLLVEQPALFTGNIFWAHNIFLSLCMSVCLCVCTRMKIQTFCPTSDLNRGKQRRSSEVHLLAAKKRVVDTKALSAPSKHEETTTDWMNKIKTPYKNRSTDWAPPLFIWSFMSTCMLQKRKIKQILSPEQGWD